ncbi:2-keto-3-deoxygluconate kinase [Reticulibacter mediterranei]|uniref:2-keto-3-deoxygluconate kinase n=1 Tax=Reticulibacter mediterranei TaxID=2778369 RepID=A0A8J3N0A5_9CHLR|nr:sugar kinase [Reticulibacter mediterranei]GHO92722.1 2-keto-3-deoxygluconate kinase [Reticulibacter mediterranei]
MAIDVLSFGETMLRLTAPGGVRLETTPVLQVYVGGTESNTLSCLARLGLDATWMSALPSTPIGRHVETELRGHGVDTRHIVWAGDSARLGTFYAEEAVNPLGLQVHYDRANSACALINPDAVNYDLVDMAKMLHLTGITPGIGEGAREVFRRLLVRAREHQVPLSFDVNYRAKLWSPTEAAKGTEEACRQARILFCARADAAELWGITGTPEEILRQMSQRFAGEGKTLVLTLGSEGSAELRNGVYATAPIFPTEGTIRFGSGDAFDAGYLYACLDGPLYQEVYERYGVTPLSFGNALASLKRCIAGDIAVVTPEEVRALLVRKDGARFR